MLNALIERQKNGEVLDMDTLRKISPEEIRIGGEINNFVDVSALVISNKLETGGGVDAVWTKNEGLHTQVSVKAKVSSQVGAGFAAELPGYLNIPNLGASFELKGTAKSNGTIELQVSAEVSEGSSAIIAEGLMSLDLKEIGLSKEEVLERIDKGDFNPSDFGLKFDIKVHRTIVKKGSVSFDTAIGGIKNQITEQQLLFQSSKEIKKPMTAFQMGLRL